MKAWAIFSAQHVTSNSGVNGQKTKLTANLKIQRTFLRLSEATKRKIAMVGISKRAPSLVATKK